MGPYLSSPGLGRDDLYSRQDYFSLGWDNLTWTCSHWTRDTSICALTLRAGSRSLHVTRGICISNLLTRSLSMKHALDWFAVTRTGK